MPSEQENSNLQQRQSSNCQQLAVNCWLQRHSEALDLKQAVCLLDLAFWLTAVQQHSVTGRQSACMHAGRDLRVGAVQGHHPGPSVELWGAGQQQRQGGPSA